MAELTQIEVWMHGRLVGRLGLTPDKPRTCAFEYTAEWLQNPCGDGKRTTTG